MDALLRGSGEGLLPPPPPPTQLQATFLSLWFMLEVEGGLIISNSHLVSLTDLIGRVHFLGTPPPTI